MEKTTGTRKILFVLSMLAAFLLWGGLTGNTVHAAATNTTIENSKAVTLGQTYEVSAEDAGNEVWFAITPAETGNYQVAIPLDEDESVSISDIKVKSGNSYFDSGIYSDRLYYSDKDVDVINLNAGTTYYIGFEACTFIDKVINGERVDVYKAYTLTFSKYTPGKIASIEITDYIPAYCKALRDAGMKGSDYNGSIYYKVNYTDGRKSYEESTWIYGKNYKNYINEGNDEGDYKENYVAVSVKSSQLDSFRKRMPGTYELTLKGYNYDENTKQYTLAAQSKSFDITIYTLTQAISRSKYEVKTLSTGKAVDVKRGSYGTKYIFKYTAKNSGGHVMLSSKQGEDYNYNVWGVYESENNTRVSWHADVYKGNYGGRLTYGKLEKGKTYYFLVFNHDDQKLSLNYYNGATNPNAAKKKTKKKTAKKKSVAIKKISVASKSITMKKGGSKSISTIVSPSNATVKPKFTSSNSKVVSVSASGTLKAKKVGKATITISGSKVKTTIKVTVKKSEIKTKKVSFKKKKLTMKKGQILFVGYSLKPASATQKISFKSSKSSVVSVDSNGKLAAKKKGKATITIKSGKKKATCTVTVK